jgi:hypothetical protein
LFTSVIGLHDVLLANGPAGLVHFSSANPYAVAAEPIRVADAGAAKVRSTVDLGLVDGVVDTVMTTAAAAQIVSGLAAGTAQLVGVGVGA